MKRTRLIFACDINDRERAFGVLEKVLPYVDVVKVGLGAMTAEDALGVTNAIAIRNKVHRMGKSIMWDMKLHDIESTVAQASRNIAQKACAMFTLHASASDGAQAAAGMHAAQLNALPLAVTVLTDLDDEQCISRFDKLSHQAVLNFAEIAMRNGLQGLVCSPREVALLRERFGDALVLVVPGVRPLWAPSDDQKRVMTPAEAARAGADYIVVGRPIYKPPLRYVERDAARLIREELDAVMPPGSIVDKTV